MAVQTTGAAVVPVVVVEGRGHGGSCGRVGGAGALRRGGARRADSG